MPGGMSQSIAWERFVHHNEPTVTLMPRPASPGRAKAGLPTRILLSAVVGLLSLLVVVGLPADGAAVGGIPQARGEVTFEQRPDTDPMAGVRSGHTMLDLDEMANHGRIATAVPRIDRAGASARLRPVSDRRSAGTDRAQPERPPRT
ncbi:MAG: hypothetical protein PGN25_19940 [Methylorubrum populi]